MPNMLPSRMNGGCRRGHASPWSGIKHINLKPFLFAMPSDEKPEPYWPPEPWRPATVAPSGASQPELEELLAHTRIEFPWPLTVENMAQIFEHVADRFGYNVAYTITSAIETRPTRGAQPTTTPLRTTVEGTVVGRGYRTHFACESPHYDSTLISALAFQVPRGSQLKDVPAPQVELMDQVREVITEYLGG